ncbi:hypothetical protein BH10PSE9_BH10PSE9_18900 [soil metagenome]
MTAPGSIPWLAAHEFRLAWRDWRSMITANNKRSLTTALLLLLAIGIAFHLPAWAMVAAFVADGLSADRETLTAVSMVVVLYASLLLSQAMESVTRTLYARGDLDLVLSSPIPPRRLFSVRIAANAAFIALIAVILSMPIFDVLTLVGGPRWLVGFGVAIAFGVTAAALAVAITLGLFRLLGPRRTRLVAQVVAAVIGAGFAIGIQLVAIMYYGTYGRAPMAVAESMASSGIDLDSPLFWPARAILGEPGPLLALLAIAAVVLATVIAVFARRFGENSIAATDLGVPAARRQRHRIFRSMAPRAALRRKEWLLLRRDPWLASQTLTQLLYLAPPAVLLVRNFGDRSGAFVVVVMVLVSVAGQLAGALAWLAISGEDAPDLVATAPVSPRTITRAKIEVVIGAVGIVLSPFLLGFAGVSPFHAVAALGGCALAAASTVQIQLWFRAQARRSQFRRRHTSSRIATFAEALTSFSWAGAAGLAASGFRFAAASALIALIILAGARSVSPRRAAD